MSNELWSCEHCGRTFGPYLVLLGWSPCRCGGHHYAYCREDNGGCGHTTYQPPKSEDECRDVRPRFGRY